MGPATWFVSREVYMAPGAIRGKRANRRRKWGSRRGA